MQLWGEAAHYESEGESIILDESLWGDAAAEQKKRRVRDPWEDTLQEIPEIAEYNTFRDGQHATETITIIHRTAPNDLETEWRVSAADLLLYVLKVPTDRQTVQHSMKLAATMKNLGWERPLNGGKVTINDRQVRGYFKRFGHDDDA